MNLNYAKIALPSSWGSKSASSRSPPSGSSSPSVSSAASLVAISSPSPPPSPVASAPAAISSAAISPAASLSAVSRSAPVLDPRSTIDPRSTADLASSGHVDVQLAATSVPASAPSVPPTITVIPSNPSKVSAKAAPVMVAAANPVIVAPIAPPPVDSWVDIFKGTTSKRLEKKGSAFTLPSGEACVAIPNSLIEKHQKSWDSFILGQFYSDPPAQGTVHTIVNGIWSKQFRDVSVSKMEGNAFLFRIPNVQTRTRVLNQRLWQIDGQTMFVAKWEPGLRPVKPELTSAPIWLELRNVPFQCFNDDGLEHIASLVGEPKFLHPATTSKTNLEVAKVFTIIDPRKPLPEAVNVQFQSGEIRRVEVSSPWMPPICAHCKEVGHSLRRCKAAPITCKACNSTQHSADACPRAKSQAEKKTPRRRRSKTPKPMLKEGDWAAVGLGKRTLQDKPVPLINPDAATSSRGKRVTDAPKQKGSVPKPIGREKQAEEANTDLEDEEQFTEVLSQRQQRSARGKETHVKQPKQQKFINKLLPGWSFDNNYDFSELGKIWILWHPSVKLLVLSKSLQMISCEVQVPDYPETFVVSFVYASNDETVRQTLWDELVALSSDSRVVGKAWAVMGDFNQTLHPSDHSATISQNVDRATRVFRETLLDASLVDLNFRGSTFTWWNKRANSPIAKKIDREGDRNTAYFHKMASSRQAVNHIHYLFDVNGSRLDSLSAIQNHCVDYFENLLGGIQGPTMFAQEDISALLSASSQAPIQHGLDSPFTAEEIKAAFFSLPKNKASGPDGYSAEFFCSCWSFVGVEITAAVAEFFSSGQLLKQWNATSLVLIPKIPNASSVADFRPISCLNTVYKVISSLLAGRLKAVLPSIIGHSQSAFMPASFSIVVNGQSGGYFRSTQGLRQGDPMSPYLFVLAMEVFSGLLQSRYSSGYISYHPRTSELEISHLMFADDVMIFFDGGGSSLQGIYETLDDFAGWSGLHMNRDKTQLFYAGLSQTESNALASYGFTVGSLPIRYLGLPLMSRKLKVSEYEPLIGKITARFNAWAVKSLSFAGRAQLIGSVISGTVNFWISTFVLPKGCIRRIESLCSRFLWSGGTEKRGLVKVAWAHVCLPKKEGGLGLRRFADWNRTMCLRLVWLLFSNSGSLWVAWHKHHNISTSTNFWNQVESTGDSWSWKSILRLREPASVFIKCSLGNGRRASFWFDSWTPLGPLYNCFGSSGPSSLRVPLNATVSDVCNHQGWIIANPRSDQGVSLQIHLSTIALPSDDSGPDEFDWVVENKICKGFSSAKTWAVTRPRAAIVDWWDSVWFKDHIPKHAFNMWIATLDRLPTKTRLSSWGLQIQDTCGLCSLSPESRDHLFLSCDFALYLWNAVSLKLNMQGIHFTLWAELLSWLKSGNRRSPPTLRKLIAQSVIYAIWKQRNNLLHNLVYVLPSVVFREVDREVKNCITARRLNKRFSRLMSLWLH
ncbi:Reverse transcriptase zinc-binding domain [Arabidopsis thaliana x Arabidopsis arenosa]|uniref:Reverse transcriptase zinc-binding domain n=1 Tax=Arabidopsis thaliana x Arabidopsis arenosa TaxID=1240361 RepID=A0A8T1XJI7_9BRAS|nr:Reverse transcriptase zinc-binding domain [Arabidopsis thaliana x Arabidopsis arenosa]